MIEATGPYLNAALVCENVIEAKDGTLSLIRIIDRVTQTATGPNAPESMPPIQLNVFLVLMFKSGSARGSHTVTIQPETPSGLRLPSVNLPALFEGEDRGVNLVNRTALRVEQEGLYWINVQLDKQLITRIPIRALYQRFSIGSPGPS